MLKSDPQRQEVTLPAEALAGLREALAAELGEDGARRALRQAGAAVGRSLGAVLAGNADDVRGLPAAAFWRRFSDLLASRGWGRLEFSDAGGAVGALEGGDWAESRRAAGGDRGRCDLSAGMLEAMLRRVAGENIAVREVECRADGDAHCRFLFGAPERVERAAAHATTGSAA